jgi:hypothetical protein
MKVFPKLHFIHLETYDPQRSVHRAIMIEEDETIADKDKPKPIRRFPIHLINRDTWLITSVLPDGSTVTVRIDGDWYGSGQPLIQVFINRHTHANLPIPVRRHPQDNWAHSVSDIDNTIARLLHRPPRPRQQAKAAAGGLRPPPGPS